MKLTHIYDHDYVVDADEVYSSGAFHFDSWDRYLAHFDELTVVANQKKMENVRAKKLNRVDRKNVSFVFLPKQSSLKSVLKGLLGRNKELEEIVKNSDALAIRLFSELGYQAVKFARKHKVPYALEIVGCPWDAYWNHQNSSGKPMAVLSYFRMKRAVAQAPFAIYVTAKFLQDRYPSKGFVRNASNVMLAEVGEEVLEKRLTHLATADSKKVITLGMIAGLEVKAKAHDVTIAALGKAKDNLPSFKLKLVGPGDSGRVLQLAKDAGIEDHVEIVGKLTSGQAIFDFLDSIDVYVHPSKQEGLPRAIIEAMSRACPTLASTTAGIPELIEPEYLHKPGDFNTLSNQMVRLMNDVELQRKVAARNFEKAIEYSPDSLGAKRNDFWGNFKNFVSQKS